MAKKKEQELTYLQMPLPQGQKSKTLKRLSWGGLNKKRILDMGTLSMERNISTKDAPYLIPSETWKAVSGGEKYSDAISLFGFDDFLLCVYIDGGAVKLDYIKLEGAKVKEVYTGILKNEAEQNEPPRCIVQFNHYDNVHDPLSGKIEEKLLIYPDRMSMDFYVEDDFEPQAFYTPVVDYDGETEDSLPPSDADTGCCYRNTNGGKTYLYMEYEEDGETKKGWRQAVPAAAPEIEYALVHVSRVFGVGKGRVYVSGYNDYTNWNLDTADEYNESNAWTSTSQSNTKSSGQFTGIALCGGHVICFKEDFMHEIYNTKNPFRILDIFEDGAIDHRSIADVGGRLFFAGRDSVKRYTGSNPQILSQPLDLSGIEYAVAGSDERFYYIYCESSGGAQLFTYDTLTDWWSQQDAPGKILSFARVKGGMFCLVDGKGIFRMDTGEYGEWEFETDFTMLESVDVRHIKKLQFFVDVPEGSMFEAFLLYDGEPFQEEKAVQVCRISGGGLQPVRALVRMSAHHSVALYARGSGFVRLYEMELEMMGGGTLYVGTND